MIRFKLSQFGMFVAIMFAANAHATGNVTFGGVPAVGNVQASIKSNQSANAVAAGAEQLPGVTRAIMPPVTMEESEKAIWSRTPPHQT